MDLLLKYDLPTLALVLALIAVIVRLTFLLLLGLCTTPPPPKKNLDCSTPLSSYTNIMCTDLLYSCSPQPHQAPSLKFSWPPSLGL